MKKKEIALIVHNVRSVYNVGSIFRTADAVGITNIYLTGYSPTPLDRFGWARKDVAKSALGAEKFVQWEYCKMINNVIQKLKRQNYFIIALEQSKKSVDYKKIKLPVNKSTVIIVGNEVKGLSDSILDQCDVIAEIPMNGKKESLNVAVSLGIALFRILNI